MHYDLMGGVHLVGQVGYDVGAYAGAARRRVHFATLLLRPPTGHIADAMSAAPMSFR